jgi:hypothetical protein
MLPVELLSGNIIVETLYLDNEDLICISVVRIFYI